MASDTMPPAAPAVDEVKDLEAQLAAAQDALTAAQAVREQASRADVLRAQIEEVKRKAREEGALAATEAKHGSIAQGKIGRADTAAGMVLVKRPDGVKVKKWHDEHVSGGESVKLDELRALARQYVVYPEVGDLDAMLSDQPLIIEPIAMKVLELGGLRLKKLAGK